MDDDDHHHKQQAVVVIEAAAAANLQAHSELLEASYSGVEEGEIQKQNYPIAKEKKSKSKQAKKERKLVGTFVSKVLKRKEDGGKSLSSEQPPYRNLLVDNRDYQVKQSTEELMQLIQSQMALNEDEPVIEDCFVLPSKVWFLLRFATTCDLATFRNALLDSDDSPTLATTTGISQSSPISDTLYELTVSTFLPEVRLLLAAFAQDEGAPQGLTVMEDFLDYDEEQALIRFVSVLFFTLTKLYSSDHHFQFSITG